MHLAAKTEKARSVFKYSCKKWHILYIDNFILILGRLLLKIKKYVIISYFQKFFWFRERRAWVNHMEVVLTKQRLTWEQIRTAYPDQWVALTDVKYMDDDGINVESAVVVCSMLDCDYVEQRLKFMKEGKEYAYERTEDTRGFVGVTI